MISSDKADIKPGNSMPLNKIPVGTSIHNVEIRPGKGGQIARGAGEATLVAKLGQYCQVKAAFRRESKGLVGLPCDNWSGWKHRP